MKIIKILLLFLVISSCSKKRDANITYTDSIIFIEKKSQKPTKEDVKNWLIKDIYADTIPGISLLKARREFLNEKSGDTIVVALIDMPLDINHEKLQKHIWKNKDEISDNKIDDDGNGYTDDINGWNFLGNTKEKILFS